MLVHQLTKVALLGASWVLYLLIGLSIVSFAAVIERLLFFRRNARGGEQLREALTPALLSNDLATVRNVIESNTSVEARVLKGALAWTAVPMVVVALLIIPALSFLRSSQVADAAA